MFYTNLYVNPGGLVKSSQSEYLLSEDHGVFNVSLIYSGALWMNVKVKLLLGNETRSNAVIGKDVSLVESVFQ